jgi:UDP-N-acetylglucosamine 2-epimerase (non-hydrolysing)
MSRILILVGTRPEAIKMAPVMSALRSRPWARVSLVSTGQHRELLDQVLEAFALVPDARLDVMRPNQTLPELTSRLITGIDSYLHTHPHDAVLAQGDTTTVLAAALVAFYRRIPFGHVEAGMRTGDMARPFPEEMNRVLASRLARWHFAATDSCRQNLLREGIGGGDIFVTGNTVIDALHDAVRRIGPAAAASSGVARTILVTMHRRESFGTPMQEAVRAIRHLADSRHDVRFLFPVHPNPNVQALVREQLGGHERITLTEPLGYLDFVRAMRDSFLILTDSGGVQEEAPALAKPVLVLREETERPEAVEQGVVRLVGTSHDAIVEQVRELLDDPAAYARMALGKSPYGDGRAAARVADVLERDLARPEGSGAAT